MALTGKIMVAGSRGLVGSAIVRRLKKTPGIELLTPDRAELDCADYAAVDSYMRAHRPNYLVNAAARVGGISENIRHPAEMIYENLRIQNNLIHLSHVHSVGRLVFFSSSCVYPREAPQPMREEFILTGAPEPTNGPFAMAKLAGMAMVGAYNSQYERRGLVLIPATLIGPGERFDLERAHVMPALVKRFCDARKAGLTEVTLWGTGTPIREILHVDDLVDAILMLLDLGEAPLPLNVGAGMGHSIAELARMVQEEAGYAGDIRWDAAKPDGIPAKTLSTERMAALGWSPRRSIREGIQEMLGEYRAAEEASDRNSGGRRESLPGRD